MTADCFAISRFSQSKANRKKPPVINLRLKHRLLYGKYRQNKAGKELDTETGLYYYGARYLDPKTSRWMSGDPALGEYLPSAPVNDEARKRNSNLPGMGGVFNHVNLHVYHYAGNNPVKYTDPDGNAFWLPLAILAVAASAAIRSDVMVAPIYGEMKSNISNINYGVPVSNSPILKNAKTRFLETKHELKIGNNILTAVGASFPVGGLQPNDHGDGRSSKRGDAMQALGFIGDVVERARNSEGYFAGDIILTVYKNGGKPTNWTIKESWTAPDGSKGYAEYSKEDALKYLEDKQIYLKELGLYDRINSMVND